MTLPRTSYVIRSHTATYPDPLIAKAGDSLQCGRTDNEYPGWVWCTHPSGRSAWVPERFLKRTGDGATLLRDYDSAELNVSVGDSLTLLEEESGWYRCRNNRGEVGWVPVSCVE